MKTHIVLSLFILSTSLHAQSEDYLPFLTQDDKQWTVAETITVTDSVGNFIRFDTTTYIYALGEISFVDGWMQRILYRSRDSVYTFPSPGVEYFGKLIEKNRKVYYEGPKWLLQEGNVILDFTLVEQDTFQRYQDDIGLPIYSIIESIDSVVYNDGITRRRFGVKTHSYNPYLDSVVVDNSPTKYYVEGMGDLQHGLFYLVNAIPGYYETWDVLHCFIQNGEVVYKNPQFAADPDCYYERIATPVRESPVRELRGLFPNPVRDVLSLDVPALSGPAKAVIYDLRGRAVARRQLGTVHSAGRLDWQLPALAAGVYVLVIEDAAAIWRGKFVKQ